MKAKKTLNNTKLHMWDVKENKNHMVKNSVRQHISESWVRRVHLECAIFPRNKVLTLKRWSRISEGGGIMPSL